MKIMASLNGFAEIQPSKGGYRDWSNSGSGRTNLKTSITIEGADGNEIKTSELSPMPNWDYLPKGSVIKYEIETISNGAGKSDKIQLDIDYGNQGAINREYQATYNSLSEEDKIAYDNGSLVIEDRINKLTEQAIIDKSIPYTVTIYSQTITTDKNGKASGTIPIDNSWPNAVYNIMIHYGYDGKGESLTWGDRMVANVIEAATYLTLIPPFTPLGAAVFVAEIAYAYASAKWLTGYGPATENKDGVSFPDYGFNHAYGFGTDEVLVDEQPTALGNFSVDNPYFLIGGSILVLLLLKRLI